MIHHEQEGDILTRTRYVQVFTFFNFSFTVKIDLDLATVSFIVQGDLETQMHGKVTAQQAVWPTGATLLQTPLAFSQHTDSRTMILMKMPSSHDSCPRFCY